MSNDIWGLDIRGGCAGHPICLAGQYNGYNTPATEQVGLWIRDDAEYVDVARRSAKEHGSERLAWRLLHIMANDWHNRPGSAAAAAYHCFQRGELGEETIDWAQIAYVLIGEEPDQDDLDRAAEIAEERYGAGATDAVVFRIATEQREIFARARALGEL
jgi:hypothetical protein